MGSRENLTGKEFGKLTVLSPAENKGKKTAWLCRCACGVEKSITTNDLKTGKSLSCGCARYANTSTVKPAILKFLKDAGPGERFTSAYIADVLKLNKTSTTGCLKDLLDKRKVVCHIEPGKDHEWSAFYERPEVLAENKFFTMAPPRW